MFSGLQRKIKTGECVRITTGAPLPPGSDAIVQVENTELIEHDVFISYNLYGFTL